MESAVFGGAVGAGVASGATGWESGVGRGAGVGRGVDVGAARGRWVCGAVGQLWGTGWGSGAA